MPDLHHHLGLRLLLVDDHAVVRSGLANMLSARPEFEVVAEVGNGEAALQTYREHAPDVIILDVMMPGMGGLECLKRLRSEHGDVKVLMLTSSEVGEDVRAALAAGADGYVTKTSSSAELIAAVIAVALIVPALAFPFTRTVWTAIDLVMRPLEFDDGVPPGVELEQARATGSRRQPRS